MIIYNIINIVVILHYSLPALPGSITFPATMTFHSVLPSDDADDVYNYASSFYSTLRQTTKVDIPLSPLISRQPHIEIAFGNPGQYFKLLLNLNVPYIWIKNITQRGYDSNSSTTRKTTSEKVYIDSFDVDGTITKDDLQIDSLSLSSFPFLVVGRSTFNDIGILGLGKGKSTEHLNFMDNLLNLELISNRVFYLNLHDNNNVLSIGEYPPEVIKGENKAYFHKHKLIFPKGNYYLSKIGTPLNAIFIEGESKLWEVNDIASFSYGTNCIIVSWDFFDHLRYSVFREALETNACSFHESKSYEYISCSRLIINIRRLVLY